MTMSEIQVSSPALQVLKTKIIRYVPGQGVSEIQPFMLLDVSGSMTEQVGTQRKIDMLRSAVSQYKGVRQYVFSDRVTETQYIPEPHGSTELHTAFRYIAKANPQKLLLVSDGLPDEPNTCLDTGKSLGIPIDVLYIGNSGDDGERFMKLLAERTKGKFMTIDTMEVIEFQKNLSDGIKFMLCA